MSDAGWHDLLCDYLERRIDERAFHDLFFALWHAASASDWSVPVPAAIEDLFFVVEAYSPDPELRDPGAAWEADEREVRAAAQRAHARLLDHGKP